MIIGKIFWCYWLPVFAYALLIFLQSGLPSSVQIPPIPHVDKLLHALAFGGLGILVFRAIRVSWPEWPAGRLMLLSIVAAGLYGISDEIHQAFVPSRYADVVDAIFNWIGAGLGVLGYSWLIRVFGGRKVEPQD